MQYNHYEIEKKWQEFWKENEIFKTTDNKEKDNFFVMDMFPYPSGSGLHVGHLKSYTATDILARFKRMRNFNVLYTMGWDAFGLPAEQYAIDTGNSPAEFNVLNINNFKNQIQKLGYSYDWDREINTSDSDYYKWTQWIFLKLFEKGLAYIDELPVNWCPALGTVLANEEIIDGKSERGGHPVERRPMKQWVLKITDYADRLLDDLDEIDWPESLKNMQRNWIGRSEGAEVKFNIEGSNESFTVFTTRPDTLFGVTYVVLAPEHPLVDIISTMDQKKIIKNYLETINTKSDLERTDLSKHKTGVFTGVYAINPINKMLIPIWIADHVLPSYGTGAIMAAPAHDESDYEFAKKFGLEIIEVVAGGNVKEEAYTGDGEHVNSDFLNGLNNEESIKKIIAWLQNKGIGEKKVTYRLRDWLFSRQRYWGEPIPIIHWEDGTITALPEEELPLILPKMTDIKPSGTGESPLANLEEWVNVVDPVTGKKGRRETNTMPQWAGSCWYYLRYIDPKNDKALADKEKLKKWLPVDIYIGGAEHAVLHLLYARFWHKFLYDCGVVPNKEPFQKLYNQGMILGENNEKMSKSKGNVENPDNIVKSHGADTLRVYEMFLGPLEASIAWNTQGLEGIRRFLERIYRLYITGSGEISDKIVKSPINTNLEKVYHQTIKRVTENIEGLRFNTAISQLMIFVNELYREEQFPLEFAEGFLIMLSPFAPHLSEEIWSKIGKDETISYAEWPKYDDEKTLDLDCEIVVQVNGKIKDRIKMLRNSPSEKIKMMALSQNKVNSAINGRKISEIIVIPDKLVNIVIKD